MTSADEHLDRMGGPELIAWHYHNGPHRSAANYLTLYRDLLVRGLSSTRLIYLDTNYWVRLRDAATGKGSSEAVKLLKTLRALVRSREALCVSQIFSLLEVGKQEAASLRASADLLDELTEGVAISSSEDLLQWECAEFIKATIQRDVGQGLCPWTKVGQIHKNELPTEMLGPIPISQREIVLKAAIDFFWNASFTYVLECFEWDTKARLSFELDAETFDLVAKRKAEQLAKGLTRAQVRLSEFSELVSGSAKPVFIDLLHRWHLARGFPEGMGALLSDVEAAVRTAIQGFADRSLGAKLPGLAITTELYSIYETDTLGSKPMSTNDWFDSCHAAAALPYCDVFLTERGLAHRLRQMLKADVQYGCEVVGTLEGALQLFHPVP